MSDNFASSAALGYLAGRYSGAQTAQAVNSFFDGLRERAEAVDVNGVLQAFEEQSQHIADQDACIDELRKSVSAWKAYGAEVEARRAKLEAYAIWAEAELKRRPPIG